ncbi:MAG: hypothetical protein HWE27_17740 [Gammaproteobacteria bacterium]|nr:hypothetical protein [Gammaproteobacteria bacterium]
METTELFLSVNRVLDSLSEMQNMTAKNIANYTNGISSKHVFSISDNLDSAFSAKTTGSNSYSVDFTTSLDSVQLDQEVLNSRLISGKYNTIIEAFNKQLGLMSIALGKGR